MQRQLQAPLMDECSKRPHSAQAIIRSAFCARPEFGVLGEPDLEAGDDVSTLGVFFALAGIDRGVVTETPSKGACSA
jgi:hypothetical protein